MRLADFYLSNLDIINKSVYLGAIKDRSLKMLEQHSLN